MDSGFASDAVIQSGVTIVSAGDMDIFPDNQLGGGGFLRNTFSICQHAQQSVLRCMTFV
jgi:hypothetical protein